MKKTLMILRGLPGSGKSTLASIFANGIGNTEDISIREADHYFYDEAGKYNFDLSKLHQAHMACQAGVVGDMIEGVSLILLSNTSTTEKELKPYVLMAETYGYNVVSLIVENRHGSKSVHGVPEETLNKMKERFSVKL